MRLRQHLPLSPRTTAVMLVGILIAVVYWLFAGPTVGIAFIVGAAIFIFWESVSAATLYPELSIFWDNLDRRRELNDAIRQAGSRWRKFGSVIVIPLAILLIEPVSNIIRQFFPNVLSVRSYQIILMAAVVAVSYYAICTWNAERIRRVLRSRLDELGHPICLGCGYDLAGNESGVCPECGQAVVSGQ